MIQEVEPVGLELEPLPFSDPEVFEQAEIGIEIRRSIPYRQGRRAVLPDVLRETEAVRVDELVRGQVRGRIAGQNRRERDVRRSQQCRGTDVLRRAGYL